MMDELTAMAMLDAAADEKGVAAINGVGKRWVGLCAGAGKGVARVAKYQFHFDTDERRKMYERVAYKYEA